MSSEVEKGRASSSLPLLLVSSGLALALLVMVELAGLNLGLLRFFNSLQDHTGPGVWAHITILGDGLVCAVLLLFWVRRHPDRVWGGLLGALFMFVVLRIFKDFTRLPRPLAVLGEDGVTVIGPGLRWGAFPSGHTATFALYAGLWAFSSRRRLVSWSLLALSVLVGASRMAVGVHWPSDVLAGLALGWASAWLGLGWAARTPWGTGLRARRILSAALMISGIVLLVGYDTGYPGVLLLQRSLALLCLVWGGVELGRDRSTR